MGKTQSGQESEVIVGNPFAPGHLVPTPVNILLCPKYLTAIVGCPNTPAPPPNTTRGAVLPPFLRELCTARGPARGGATPVDIALKLWFERQ